MVGEVPVQADGSFAVEVPADTPVGFEALDARGQVVRLREELDYRREAQNLTTLADNLAGFERP